MNIYLSARYSSAKLCNAAMVFLKPTGHAVTSRWHRAISAGGHGEWNFSRAQAERYSQENLIDIAAADILIGWVDDEAVAGARTLQRGARHTELGVAWGLGKTIILISGGAAGEIEHIYQAMPNIKFVGDLQEAIKFLEALDMELKSAAIHEDIAAFRSTPVRVVTREMEAGYVAPR